jgi:hypothetical protein
MHHQVPPYTIYMARVPPSAPPWSLDQAGLSSPLIPCTLLHGRGKRGDRRRTSKELEGAERCGEKGTNTGYTVVQDTATPHRTPILRPSIFYPQSPHPKLTQHHHHHHTHSHPPRSIQSNPKQPRKPNTTNTKKQSIQTTQSHTSTTTPRPH